MNDIQKEIIRSLSPGDRRRLSKTGTTSEGITRAQIIAIAEAVDEGSTSGGLLAAQADTTPAAENIRPASPRQVALDKPTSMLSEQERDRVQELQSKITEQRELAEVLKDRGLSSNTERLALAAVQNNINQLEEELNGLTTVTVNGIDLTVKTDSASVQDNPLNKYVNVQYHISLTMVSEEAARLFQKEGIWASGEQVDIDTMKKMQREDQSVALASTGEVFRNGESEESKRNYYSIVSTVVKNMTEPSDANPLVSTMLSMKMRIAEPHGFKFHEDIRDTAIQLGYKEINNGRILYRVDIYWSGYNQDTGEWTEQIDLGGGIKMVSSIMCISAIEAEITSSGTMYEVDFVPAGHHAYRPEDFIIDASDISSGSNLRAFLTNFSAALKTAKENRTQGRILRNYEFYAPDALLDSPFDINQFIHQNRFLFEGGSPEHTVSSGRGVDILTVLRGVLANTQMVQDSFLADQNNDDYTQPSIHFAIRFNTVYNQPDPELHDYKEITHQYIIEPFITFRHGRVTTESIKTYVAPQSQLSRIREIIRFGMLRRIYNYIYTAENTEVIDFDVKLKAFYFETLNSAYMNSGVGRHGHAGSASMAMTDDSDTRELFRITGIEADEAADVDGTMRRLFGDVRSEISTTGSSSREGPERLGGGHNDSPDVEAFSDGTSPPNNRRYIYENHMRDYLNLDLLRLNGMKVRGDPAWLLNPYSNHDIGNLSEIAETAGIGATSQANIKVRPRTGQIIFLRLFAPHQDDTMNPNRARASSYPNIIGGFYQVSTIVSTFENGNFTQNLEGVKLNHLNYVEELFERTASAARSTE